MKKRFLTVVLIFVIAALLCLGACSTLENDINIEDAVVSRFGDGFSILEKRAAPKTATEYKDVERVTAKVNVDARMSGYHITGLYLPANEILTVTVPETVRLNHYSVYVDTYSSETRASEIISQSTTRLKSASGGIVEILVPKNDDITADSENASFNMTIEGGIVIPYYRLGRDSIEQIEQGDGAFAILDCVNTRFYVPTSILYDEERKCKIDDLYNVLLWWQSAVSFVNETLGIANSSRDYTSSIVFGNYSSISYDSALRVTYAPISYFEKCLFYSNLIEGEAWDILYNICNYKTRVVGGNDGVLSQEAIIDVLCAVDHVVMTNPGKDSLNDINWLNNSYTCLKGTLELLSHSSEDLELRRNEVVMAFFINILHSFGLDKTIEIISGYRQSSDMDIDEFALMISTVLRADMGQYFDMFGMQLSQATKDKMSGNNLYIPVQTLFTIGNEANNYNMGYTVAMGEKAVFNFGENIVSLIDGWKVDKVVGAHQNLWSKDSEDDSIYYYTPSQDALIDEFELTLSSGEYTITLYGKINVTVTVATYKIYDGWKFDNPTTALSEAISSYEKRTPSKVGSIDFAGVRRRSDEYDPSEYALTVTSGCMRVPKSGKYRFYLRNNGRCKVEFGVPKYMFTMFDISIPFQEFTRGHSYDIDLDEGVNYYFNLYLLSTKGACDAALGIRYIEDEDITDDEDHGIIANIIDSDYLIYNGLSDDKIAEFVPPVIYPTGYGQKDEFYKAYELEEDSVVDYPRAFGPEYEIEYALDDLRDSYYTSFERQSRFDFTVNMGGNKRLEFVQFYVRQCSPMVGKTVELTLSDSAEFVEFSTVAIEDNVIKAGMNTFKFNSAHGRYVKLSFVSQDAFECSFTDLKIGQHFDASQIVPNTSSNIAYMGGWSDVKEYVCINGSVSESVDANSVLSFTALTRQICVYGVKDEKYGKMDVYIDGSHYETIDLYSETTMTDQLLFAIDFDLSAEHSVKVMPHSDKDKINVDYISYIPIVKEEIREYTGFLYGAIAIPVIIIIALVGAAIADSVDKKKRKKRQFSKPEKSDIGEEKINEA